MVAGRVGGRMAKRKVKKKKPRRRPAPRKAARKSGRKSARKANDARAIQAVLAGIAHDIRTPLTGIVALAELLASSNLGAREREWANALKSGADHLTALSNLIVDAAKADSKGLVLRNDRFSPRALAENIGAVLTARASGKNVRTEIQIADDLPLVVAADVVRLRAALENLADNAVKFTHEGNIAFTATAESNRKGIRLAFSIADSGIGISPSELKHLFRPFTQASTAIARRYGGAGLGLSLVKRIAKAMGGDLTVVSNHGSGSTFELTIMAERVVAVPATDRVDLPPVSIRPLSILCAEDNPYGRIVMNTILRELGHHVDFVETGDAAVTATMRGNYDAILMDVTLGGLNGIEATRRIRALPGSLGRTPVIGFSGRSEPGEEQAARAAGMNGYLLKPVSPRKLVETLASVAS